LAVYNTSLHASQQTHIALSRLVTTTRYCLLQISVHWVAAAPGLCLRARAAHPSFHRNSLQYQQS
jgi:hypothetical protein